MNEVPALTADKRETSEKLLAEVFRLMEYPAKLEFKDMPDGSLGVNVHFDGGELPGVTPGKRSFLVDSVQFWLNKVVNRPNTPRRWVNLAVDGWPEPRGQQQPPKEQTPSNGTPPAPKQAAPAPAPKKDAPPAPKQQPPQQQRPRSADEKTLTPAANPAVSAVGKLLAEKSAKLGRLYGVMLLSPDQRALMLKEADAVKGVSAKCEGEGHWRRLVMVPEKLTVIPKKQVMPDYDDDEEDE